jgi:hypothetical protein
MQMRVNFWSENLTTWQASENKIKTDHKKTGCEEVDWIQPAHGEGPVAGTCDNNNEH